MGDRAAGRLRDSDPDAFRHETGLEIDYRIQLLPWLAVTPDLQYIVEPGAAASSSCARPARAATAPLEDGADGAREADDG